MGKSDERNVAAEQEFSKLEQVLNQTADDASNCLKLLKNNLSDYDSRHGNHFTNTAKSYLRSDMRTAKDTSSDLKHVAHQINKSHKPSESEVTSARNMLNATSKAMDILKMTARSYDEKNGKSTGVTGMVDNVVGGKSDKDKDDKQGGGLFGKSDKDKDTKQGGGLFGKSDKDKDTKQGGGLFGKDDHDKHAHHGGGGVLGKPDTVEELVKSTIHDHFSVNALNQQITSAERSLLSSPSLMDRAKEAVHDVTDKLKGDKSSPRRDEHHSKHVNP